MRAHNPPRHFGIIDVDAGQTLLGVHRRGVGPAPSVCLRWDRLLIIGLTPLSAVRRMAAHCAFHDAQRCDAPAPRKSTSEGGTSVETAVPFDADSGLLGVDVRCPCPDPIRHAHRHRYRSPEGDRARRHRRRHQRRHERVAGAGHQRRRSLHRAPAARGHVLHHRDPVRLRAVQAIGHHPQRDRDRARACRVVGRRRSARPSKSQPSRRCCRPTARACREPSAPR